MKEYERAIEKGILPKDYLREEVKCDFLVTEQRKKIWAVMMDLFDEFDRVCKKYGFSYSVYGGSLLGAIRHNGFIPWDDDFDVAMPRKDYDEFVTLSEEFQDPYFLQTPYTDPEYAYSFAKIRNSNTTGLVEMFQYADFNHGIWITVFPLDYWELEGGEERYSEIRRLITCNSTFMRIKNPHLDEKNKKRVAEYLNEHRDPLSDYEEIQRLASCCKNQDSEYVTTAVLTGMPYKQKLWHTADFAETVNVTFEGLTVPAPCGYHRVLTQWYGDYMQFPPVEERGQWHAGTIFDVDIPYKQYLLEHYGIEA